MSQYSEWAKGAYDEFGRFEADTTFENIKRNREKFLPYYKKAEKLGETKQHDAFYYCHEWMHYFDNGYKSPENIDTLPDKFKDALADLSVG